MKAVVVNEDKSLSWQEVSDPVCAPGEVLVAVHYTALNRADLMQRAGNYPVPTGASEVLGLELSGVVLETNGPSAWRPGDRVCALLSGGGYAERACVPERLLMPIPKDWTLAEAAGMPEVFYTAFLNLFLEAGLKGGERVLVHGGASGVGTAAIQLAREAGCEVFATAGTSEKVARCRELGANTAVNYREQDFAEVIAEKTNGEGVDVILDMVGADYFERNLSSLATGGRLVFISSLSGSKVELDIRKLMAKRASIKGSTLRARPLEEKVALKEAFTQQFWEALERGRVKPVVDRVFGVQDAEAAHAYMQGNKNIGKLLLEVRA